MPIFNSDLSRRQFLTRGAAVAGVGSLGWLSASAASASPTEVLSSAGSLGSTGSLDAARIERKLLAAMHGLHKAHGGPPAVVVTIGRGAQEMLYTAGTADLGGSGNGVRPPTDSDHMRLASVSKAFSGAAALVLVTESELALDDSIGRRLSDSKLPPQWAGITLAQLLGHTSGIPDFSATDEFAAAVQASLDHAPPPRTLLSYVTDPTLKFTPGTAFAYSNSDNVLVGLMIEAATGRSYDEVLHDRVCVPRDLPQTTLPSGSAMPRPYLHGYDTGMPGAPEDVSTLFAAGWAWAAGGVVSTPADTLRFVRAYVRGDGLDDRSRRAQFRFRRGASEPPGPGVNSAGLALFRYDTKYGRVFGHTGNTSGYTQFAAATEDGDRGAVVSATTQLSPGRGAGTDALFAQLRSVFELAVGTALAP